MPGDSFTAWDELHELAESFADAEEHAKNVEQHVGQLAIPAINELRYAAAHTFRALKASTQQDQSQNIQQAKGHCKRATYDACEAGVIYCLEKVAQFQQDYRNIPITPVVPDFVEIRGAARRAQELIRDANPHRDDVADQCAQQFNQLIAVVERLEDARPELNKETARIRRDDRTNARRWQFTSLLIGLGLLVALARLVWQ